MPRKALEIVGGNIQRTPDLVESAEVAATPTGNAIPRADAAGKLDSGWIGSVPFAALPVAESGEVSSTKVVAADDARLGNPSVGGDLSGTAQAATVVKLQGRAFANVAPANGQGIVWNQSANRWEPATVGGDAGNATQIQGRPVGAAAPATGDTLVWDGTQWGPAAGGGGGSVPDHVLAATALYLSQRGPFG
jgi:hypothetical protein